jgi:hypothetical protein
VFGRRTAWGAGVAVALGAVNGALINELHGGWPWWAAAGAVTLAGALFAVWMASGSAEDDGSVEIQDGAVYAGRNIAGRVRTRHDPGSGSPQRPRAWRRVGRGAVAAGKDITTAADIDTTGNAGREVGR